MEIRLSGKTALVTGGSGGIGESCVRLLRKSGAKDFLIMRSLSFMLLLTALMGGVALSAAQPDDGMRSKIHRFESLLKAAKADGADTRPAERLNQLSRQAAKAGDGAEAEKLLDQAISDLGSKVKGKPADPTAHPTADDDQRPTPRGGGARRRSPATPAEPKAVPNGGAPVFFLAFTHHYAGPGGYYPKPEEVRRIGELFVKLKVPGTLFFDGILVERLLKEDPGLIKQVSDWGLPLGYHGEETHGPYPVASELLGEVHTLKEAQGYSGQWSLTTGKDWGTAVKLVTERYSHSRPWRVDEGTRMLDRRQPSETDLAREGGLALVQKAFGKDIAMMTSHGLESAPEGYAFRRMSNFRFDQPAVPLALHALRIFRIGDAAEQVMRIAGENESIFWYMGRLTSKGDESGEAGLHLGGLRAKLSELDRSRPRLLLTGVSKVVEEEVATTIRYLESDFFPANPGSCWVTGDTLPSFFEPEKGWRPTPSDIREMAKTILKDWAARPPDMVDVNGRKISLCDAFEALARFLAAVEAGKPSEAVELSSMYGPVAEDGSTRLRAPTRLSGDETLSAATRVVRGMNVTKGDRFVPALVLIRDDKLNAAEFLNLMAQVVAASGKEQDAVFTVPPSNLFPPYAEILQEVFKPKSAQPLCYTKGQLWTVKPARLLAEAKMDAKAENAAAPSADTPTSSGRLLLAFAANLDSEQPCFRDEHTGADLYLAEYDLATAKASNLRRLTNRSGLAEWFPAISPDRSTVVYDCEEDPGSGGKRRSLRRIILKTGEDADLLPDARFPAFQADGGALFFSRQNRGVQSLLMTPVKTAGGFAIGPETVISDSRTLDAELTEDPGPLPDGKQIVFHMKRSGKDGAGVGIIGTDGKGFQELTPFNGCGHATASAAGNTIACTRSRDGRVVLIRKDNGRWLPPGDLPLSTNPSDYSAMDKRFADVKEVRHCYIEWVSPDAFLLTSHGADGPRSFRFARLFLIQLKGFDKPPAVVDVSSALESLAGKKGKDFCSASAAWIRK